MCDIMPKYLDVDDIMEKVRATEKKVSSILDQTDPNCVRVLVIGVTGSGKSTLVNCLAGVSLESDNRYKLRVKNGEGINGFRIGHGIDSQTLFPEAWNSNTGSVIWDCPGFLDSRGEEQEIVNGFAIDQIFQRPNKTKILYLIKECDFDCVRGGEALKGFQKLLLLVPNMQQLKQALVLVVTHVNANGKFTSLQLLENLREDVQASDGICNNKDVICDLLQYIIQGAGSNRVLFSFVCPEERNTPYTGLSQQDKTSLLTSLSHSPVKDIDHVKAFSANVVVFVVSYVSKLPTLSDHMHSLRDFLKGNYRDCTQLNALKEWQTVVRDICDRSVITTSAALLNKLLFSALPAALTRNQDFIELMDSLTFTEKFINFARSVNTNNIVEIAPNNLAEKLQSVCGDMLSDLNMLVAEIQLEQENKKLEADLEEGKINLAQMKQEMADSKEAFNFKLIQMKSDQDALEAKHKREDADRRLEYDRLSNQLNDLQKVMKDKEKEAKEALALANSKKNDSFSMSDMLSLFSSLSVGRSGGGGYGYGGGGPFGGGGGMFAAPQYPSVYDGYMSGGQPYQMPFNPFNSGFGGGGGGFGGSRGRSNMTCGPTPSRQVFQSSGSRNGAQVFTGPRGGRYTMTSSGGKNYSGFK